jgi:hypothetical protein
MCLTVTVTLTSCRHQAQPSVLLFETVLAFTRPNFCLCFLNQMAQSQPLDPLEQELLDLLDNDCDNDRAPPCFARPPTQPRSQGIIARRFVERC